MLWPCSTMELRATSPSLRAASSTLRDAHPSRSHHDFSRLGAGTETTIVCLIRDSSEEPNALRPLHIRWIAPEGVEFREQQLRLIEPFTKGNSPVWESLTRVKATGTIATLRTAIARLDLDGVAAGQVQIVFAATEKEPR